MSGIRRSHSALRNLHSALEKEGGMKEIAVPELLRTLEALRAKLDGLGSYL